MSFVNVNHLKEGMVLAEDLFASKNRFLLAKGTTIVAKHIRIMKSWGVTEANIIGISQAEAAAEAESSLDPQVITNSKQYVEKFFIENQERPEITGELKRLCMLRADSYWERGRNYPQPLGQYTIPET